MQQTHRSHLLNNEIKLPISCSLLAGEIFEIKVIDAIEKMRIIDLERDNISQSMPSKFTLDGILPHITSAVFIARSYAVVLAVCIYVVLRANIMHGEPQT